MCNGNPVAVHQAEDRLGQTAPAVMERTFGHMLIVVHSGEGEYLVDFVDYPVGEGSVLHVQPNQAHRWSKWHELQATVLAVDQALVPKGLFDMATTRPLVASGSSADVVRSIVADLAKRSEVGIEPTLAVASVELLFRQVAAANASGPAQDCPTADVLPQDLLPQDLPQDKEALVASFRAELERSHGSTRAVSHYARAVGASTKTLSRTTAVVADASPKELIDRRVVLEAKRLLAATSDSASSIGSELGFSEPTNFTKFFVRHTGLSPQEFRLAW